MEPNIFFEIDENGDIQIEDYSVWAARKTKTVFLRNWNIVDLDIDGEKTSHFVGTDTFDNTGRISTNIEQFSNQKIYTREDGSEKACDGVAFTKSGTEYVLLEGPSMLGRDAEYLYNRIFGFRENAKMRFQFKVKK